MGDTAPYDAMVGLLMAAPGVYFLQFLILVLFGNSFGKLGSLLSISLSLIAFGFSLVSIFHFFPDLIHAKTYVLFRWLDLDQMRVDFAIRLDGPVCWMMGIVTGITALVHIFSTAYMRGDPKLNRYWAFLGLFAGSMCMLLLVQNLFLTFIFWELVGASSYLLVGFWFEKPGTGPASQKAFILNRIGDAGFLAGLGLLWYYFGTLDLNLLYHEFSLGPQSNFLQIGFLLMFMGVISKSAQFPLQVWLPDAMKGPTPASALIHAATMVAAGVFLLFRIGPLLTPATGNVVVVFGAITAFIGAYSAWTQYDIKRVLAYSTISQLGFMVMAVGLGAGDWGFFHLITHAFFKAGLFLGAGAIIHLLHHAAHHSHSEHDVQDLRLMGGLWKRAPLLGICYLIGAGALVGLPLTSGFLSKEGILSAATAWAEQGPAWRWAIPGLGWITTGLTGLYISRQVYLIWAGPHTRVTNPRFDEKIQKPNFEIWFPVLILALFSSAFVFSGLNPFQVGSLFPTLTQGSPQKVAELAHGALSMLPLFFAIGGILGGVGLARREVRLGFPSPEMGWIRRISHHHFYLDRFYESRLGWVVLRGCDVLVWVDRKILDGMVRGLAGLIFKKKETAPSLSQILDSADHQWVDSAISHLTGAVDQGKEKEISLSAAIHFAESKVIDPAINGVAGGLSRWGKSLSKMQSGKLQRYLIFSMLILIALMGLLLFFVYKP